MLSRFLDANSPKIDSATASPYEGDTSYQVIPASYARSSASSPLRTPIREPSEAQPSPTLDTLLPRASTQTCFIANTHFQFTLSSPWAARLRAFERRQMVHQSHCQDGRQQRWI